jgi:hypothetical protein
MEASRPPIIPDFEFPEQPTHSLAVYDTMLKVKPYPNTCPFGDADFVAGVQAEEVMPAPSSAEAAALQKLYSKWLPGASSVLEIVCDGRSRVKTRRQCPVTQLHLTSQSYKAGRRHSRKHEHVMWPATFGEEGADLPWAAGEFDLVRLLLSHNRPPHPPPPARAPQSHPLSAPTPAPARPRHRAQTLTHPCPHSAHPPALRKPPPCASRRPPPQIVCHGCIPYVSTPLHLFAELSRVLAPSGTPRHHSKP